MAFLMKHIGGFFTWWHEWTGLTTVKYKKFSVDYSMLAFVALLTIFMVALAALRTFLR